MANTAEVINFPVPDVAPKEPRVADLDDGYTRLANELLDAVMCSGLPETELCILMAVWRKTYGYNKKMDWISNEQLCEAGQSKVNPQAVEPCSHRKWTATNRTVTAPERRIPIWERKARRHLITVIKHLTQQAVITIQRGEYMVVTQSVENLAFSTTAITS